MKKLIACSYFVLVFSVSALHAENKPVAFKNEKGGFEVMTPMKLTETTQPDGDLTFHMFIGETKETACIVSYNDFPKINVEATNPQKLLDGGRDGGPL